MKALRMVNSAYFWLSDRINTGQRLCPFCPCFTYVLAGWFHTKDA